MVLVDLMHTTVAITISPPHRSDNIAFSDPNLMTYLEDRSYIRQILNYNRIRRYIIYPEFDDKGRLHYHGTITLDHNQYVRFHKHAIHKFRRLGFTDIKSLKEFDDKLRWSYYIKKNWGLTKEILSQQEPMMVEIKSKQTDKISKDIKSHSRDNISSTILDYFSIKCP